jgi:hypothetical protein
MPKVNPHLAEMKRLYAEGVAVSVIQKLAGYANPETVHVAMYRAGVKRPAKVAKLTVPIIGKCNGYARTFPLARTHRPTRPALVVG